MKNRTEIQFEFPINCSANILFNYLSTSTGLEGWFAKKVINKTVGNFEFHFDDDTITKAKLIKKILNKLVRFQWENAPDGEFMEIEIITDELTEDVAIKIHEHCSEEEKNSLIVLWHSQLETLRHTVGS